MQLVAVFTFILILGELLWGQSQHYRDALEKYQANSYFEAMLHARKAVEQEPENSMAHWLYASVLASLQQFNEAEKHFREAIRLQSDSAELHYEFAQFLLNQQETLALHPFSPRAKQLMQEATVMLRRALELSPDHLGTLFSLARTYHNMNFSQSALEQFAVLARKDPKFPWLHFNIGMVYSSLAKEEDAIQEFATEIRLYPQHARARVELAELLLQKGKAKDALEQLLAAMNVSTSATHRLYFLLAKAYREMGESGQAVAAVKKSIELCPGFVYPHFLLAQLLQERGELDLARAQMETVDRLRKAGPSAADPFVFREGLCPTEKAN